MKPRSRSDKGDQMGEGGEVLLAKMRFGHTNRHFIIIYISSCSVSIAHVWPKSWECWFLAEACANFQTWHLRANTGTFIHNYDQHHCHHNHVFIFLKNITSILIIFEFQTHFGSTVNHRIRCFIHLR